MENTTKQAKKHFKILADEEMELKRLKLKNNNTKKQNIRTDKAFCKFLEECDCFDT